MKILLSTLMVLSPTIVTVPMVIDNINNNSIDLSENSLEMNFQMGENNEMENKPITLEAISSETAVGLYVDSSKDTYDNKKMRK